MSARVFCSGGVALALILLFSVAAEAKAINLGVLSRTAVELACARAHGTPFGLSEDNAQYGCTTSKTIVACLPDSTCSALVGDLTPTTGNSLNTILGAKSTGQPHAIRPIDARVTPVSP